MKRLMGAVARAGKSRMADVDIGRHLVPVLRQQRKGEGVGQRRRIEGLGRLVEQADQQPADLLAAVEQGFRADEGRGIAVKPLARAGR